MCRLKIDGQVLSAREIAGDRPDVNKHFQLPSDERCGFSIVVDLPRVLSVYKTVQLQWETPDGVIHSSGPLDIRIETDLSHAERSVLAPVRWVLADQIPLNSPEWRQLVTDCPAATTPCRTARGFLEGAAACDQTSDGVVVGWVVHQPGTRIWLEDESGHAHALDEAFRCFRQDVHEAVGHEFVHGSREAGFVLHIHGLKAGAVLRFKALAETGLHTLGETACSALPVDPVGAARWLFAVGTPLSDLHKRIPLVDEPVLQPLIDHRQSIWDELPVEQRTLGKPPGHGKASIIIPLHGRIDFVEHQLIEFSKDPWLAANAEVIYTLDDPRIVERFRTMAETLHRLYKLPLKWVWGGVNRGFSGANNLGAKFATGECLVFLNSDAFPQHPGWVAPLIDALESHPELGAVGTRLVFGDGGIQHGGMEFRRREDLGIWTNHHPRMGLDPSLDPHTSLTRVPAVTGACLAIRRTDFDDVDGWNTGYLIGDFEDSDLCLKLRERGLHIGYLPTVQLTHLERQSFKLLGDDEFRQRVVIFNAVRHQTRWRELIEQPVRYAMAEPA